MIRVSAATGMLLLASLLSAGTAHAAEPRIAVVAHGCGEIDTNEIALLLELELAESAGAWSNLDAPPVTITCVERTVSITVDDPVTGKRLQRNIPPPEEHGEGRERALALAVSQLFLTSWLELLLPPDRRPAMTARPAQEVRAATERARRAIATPAPPLPAPRPHRLARITILGGARVRDLATPYAAVHTGVRAGISIDGEWDLFAQAAFEHGQAERTRGTVETWLGDFGVGAGWRSPSAGPWALEVRAIFSALYLRMQGVPGSAGVDGHDTATASAQAALEAGPTLDLGWLRLGLVIEGGVTFFAPIGRVQNEPAVEPAGAFLGARLEASVLW